MARLLKARRPAALGIAVSGGGDSTALLHLAARWGGRPPRLLAASVDHGLREGSDEEARAAGRAAAALGVAHAVLPWRWDGAGNLQRAAREGRYARLGAWAREAGLDAILLGHTMDDQAETLVLRLARGSGVDGLSAMAEGPLAGIAGQAPLLRPLLGIARADLRAWLRGEGIAWAEDPSNDDPRFARARARRAIAALSLDPRRLAATAARMARAREALERRAFEAARALRRPSFAGDVALSREGLAALDEETRLRLLAGALRAVSGAPYRPREADLLRACAAAAGARAATLHGCAIRPWGDAVLIHREAAAVAACAEPVGGPLWDAGWRLQGAAIAGCEVRALGEAGLRALNGAAREAGAPRAALMAKPAAWRGEALAGFAPLAFGAPHEALWEPPGGRFPDGLLAGRSGRA